MNIGNVLKKLIENNESVPKPLRLPTETEVVSAERDLCFVFPTEYRMFQLQASHVTYGVLEPGIVLPETMAYLDLREIAKDGWAHGIPKDHLPFCPDNGNYHTISLEGEIGFFDHDEDSHHEYNLSFAEWVLEYWFTEYE